MLQFAEKGWGYLNGFLRKRVLRLYIPFALCTLFVGILQNSAPQRILWNILTFSFFIDPSGTPNATWFVIAIIVFSIGFYISAKYKNGRYIVQGVFLSSALWIVLCFMIGVGTWWYNTAWSFPLGVWLCQQRKKVYKWVCDHYRMVVIELVALFCGTYLVMAVWRSQVLLQMICSSAFALLTWVLCMRVNLNGAIGKWFGGFTLELFLVHSAILKTFYGFGITNAGWSILLVLFTSVIAGNWMNHLSKWIIRKVLQ